MNEHKMSGFNVVKFGCEKCGSFTTTLTRMSIVDVKCPICASVACGVSQSNHGGGVIHQYFSFCKCSVCSEVILVSKSSNSYWMDDVSCVLLCDSCTSRGPFYALTKAVDVYFKITGIRVAWSDVCKRNGIPEDAG